MDPGIARHVGARLLGGVEEESLESLLTTFQHQTSLQLEPGPSSPSSSLPRPDPSSVTTPTTTTVSEPFNSKLRPLPPGLQNLATRHHHHQPAGSAMATVNPLLSVTGRYLPLLYHLVSTVVATPHRYAVLVVDPEARFDVSRLVSPSDTFSSTNPNPDPDPGSGAGAGSGAYPATPADLRHVHVLRPSLPPTLSSPDEEGTLRQSHQQQHLRDAVAAAREWILYAPTSGSRDRELWGTVVLGGGVTPSSLLTPFPGSADGGSNSAGRDDGVLVTAGWKGWLRVEREEVAGFGAAGGGARGGHHGVMSVEEALTQRRRRMETVGNACWVAGSRWGVYAWR